MTDCQFHPEAIAIWADRKNMRFLSDAQREDSYLRAAPFLLEQMKALIEKGWTRKSDKPNDDGILFDLTYYNEEKLTLPSTFNAFLDASKEDTWRKIFTNSWAFLAAWKEDDENDLFVDSSPPLCNIFYLLQVLAPGMLVIRRGVIDDVSLRAVSRALPRKSWIEEHHNSLEEIIGSTGAMKALLIAAEDQNAIAYDAELETRKYFRRGRDHDHDSDDDDYDYNDWGDREEPRDFTACSLECGYCGRCDY